MQARCKAFWGSEDGLCGHGRERCSSTMTEGTTRCRSRVPRGRREMASLPCRLAWHTMDWPKLLKDYRSTPEGSSSLCTCPGTIRGPESQDTVQQVQVSECLKLRLEWGRLGFWGRDCLWWCCLPEQRRVLAWAMLRCDSAATPSSSQ